MSLVQINLPLELVQRVAIKIIDEGFESIEDYIETTLNNDINKINVLTVIPQLIKRLDLLNSGDVFNVTDLIDYEHSKIHSIAALQEMDELLQLYLTKNIHGINYEILAWDFTLFINTYIKLSK